MTEAQINDTTIWFDVEGDGPPVLVMHGGLGVDHAMYKATMRHLVDHHTVVWYDHRGNGRSGRPLRETITMEQLADDAAALLDHIDFPSAAVLGHSYGGFVAQELALRHPNQVDKLLLIATGPGQLGGDEIEGEDGQGVPMPEGLLAAFSLPAATDDDARALLRAALPFYAHQFEPTPILDGLDETIVSIEAMLRGDELLTSWSAVDRLDTISTPTLVLGGKHDPVMSWPQQVRIAKRVPNAEIVVLDNASHFAWLDDPDAFWEAVDRFLS